MVAPGSHGAGWPMCRAGGELATSGQTAKQALEIARQWAAKGATNIIITNPEGVSYDLDHFGMLASTKDEGSNSQ